VLADEYFHDSLALARTDGNLADIAGGLMGLARSDQRSGATARSREYREAALRVQRQIGDEWGVAFVMNELGQQARVEGQLARARSLELEAFRLWRASGSQMGERAALMNLTVITLECGNMDEATRLADQVLELCQAIGDASATTVRCIEIAARVLQARGASELAVRLLGAATAQRDILGAPLPPDERSEHGQVLASAEVCLPPIAYLRGLESGASLSIQQAVEQATAVVRSLA
jgi:hypothetical protein